MNNLNSNFSNYEFNHLFHVKTTERDELRPYPIRNNQDKTVKNVLTFHSILSIIIKVIKAIAYPIFSLFNSLTYPIRRFILKERSESKIIQTINTQKIHSQPTINKVYVGNENQCFDSKFYYHIHENRLWFKPKGLENGSNWRLFGETGLPTSIKGKNIGAKFVSADGDNLIIIDTKNRVHYTKTNHINLGFTEKGKGWKVTNFKTNWTTKWYSMTLIASIRNQFSDPTLIIDPKKIKKIAISQKGGDTLYYTDTLGKKHPEPFVGVTTLYALSEDGTEIFFADPWLANKFKNSFTSPLEGRFQAENIAAAGSTVFLIQRYFDEHGKERNKMFTRFVDYDSSANNRLLPGTYNPKNNIPLVRYYLPEDWTEQPEIQLNGNAKLSSDISILQTGRGNSHRMLYVRGTNAKGDSGCYYKSIYSREWEFEKTDETLTTPSFIKNEKQIGIKLGQSFSKNFTGYLTSKLSFNLKEVRLSKFLTRGSAERGLHTTIDLTLPSGKVLHFNLRATQDLSHFFSAIFGKQKKEMHWDLIVPDAYFQDNDTETKEILKKLFNNKHSIRVNVEEGDHIKIWPRFWSSNLFEFNLNNVLENT